LTVCKKNKTPKKIPKTGKSQKWISYPTDTQQNPHPKNHEEPKKRTWSTNAKVVSVTQIPEDALDRLPM
jgi:hypothetical protein